MLLTTSLPLFAPPPTSLLPPLSQQASESPSGTQPQLHQHASRRSKQHSAALRNSNLAILSSDERTIAQRKMAIAMYGYSWLKPAGCAKTMLGRREEEVEREEAERQLRELELQERQAQEADEQERLARLAETGEPEEGRDLDEDIPDMDGEGFEEEDEEGDLDDEIPDMDGDDGMEGDLDDEIPEPDDDDDEDEEMSPDPAAARSTWVYDSRREPDTDEETQDARFSSLGRRDRRSGRFRHGTAIVAGVRVPVPGSEYDYDEREAEDLANTMLDEDEIFDDDEDAAMDAERDLDDDVPEPESEQAWEHTDTELEDSEMDISILPPSALTGGGQTMHQQRASLGRSRHGAGRISGGAHRSSGISAAQRRSSGPWIAEPSPPTMPASAAPRARMVSGNQRPQQQYLQTPEMRDFSPMSTGGGGGGEQHPGAERQLLDPFNSSVPQMNAAIQQHEQQYAPPGHENPQANAPSTRATARSWLDGAAAAVGGSARRTLFGRAARRGNAAGTASGTAAGTSSGGLFTPSPLAGAGGGSGGSGATAAAAAGGDPWTTPTGSGSAQAQEQGQGQGQAGQRQHQRRRSGRFLGGAGRRRGAGAGDGVDS